MRVSISSRFEVGCSFGVRGAQRPQKRGHRLVETSVDLDSEIGTTIYFMYCTSPSNFMTSKSLICFVFHYMLIEKYFHFSWMDAYE